MEQQTIARRIQLNNTKPDTVGFLDETHISLSLGPGGDQQKIILIHATPGKVFDFINSYNLSFKKNQHLA